MNVNTITPNLDIANISISREEAQTADFEAILERASKSGDTSEIREAAVQMESLFIYQMFQAMRRTVPEPQGFFERSNAERIFTEMLDEEKANIMASAGGIGIADAIYRELTR